MTRSAAVLVLLLLAAPSPAATGDPAETESPDTGPRDLGLLERTSSRLAQLDVTVTGPEDRIESLRPADFYVSIAGRRFEEFVVDRVCREPREGDRPQPGAIRGLEDSSSPVETTSNLPATYLFYFDQPHLTMAGRANAIEIAKELASELIRDGNRGFIVSNAEELETIEPMTEDSRALRFALDRLAEDRSQWDTYAALEENRATQVIEALRRGKDEAVNLARQFQQEERWRAEKDLRRLAMVLARMAEERPPKIAIYFADTMRGNAGEHYLSFFGQAERSIERETGGNSLVSAMELESETARLPMDRLLHEASALGIRLYTVEPQGLQSPGVNIAGGSGSGLSRPGTPALNTVRIRDAQNTLVSLAKETGGASFLNGVPAAKIARKIVEDLSCLYILSFDPAGLPEDQPLPVRVTVEIPKVHTQVRGQIVIQSESARLTSRLLSAFADPASHGNEVHVSAGLIPLGLTDSGYAALVQVAVPGSFVAGATWDLGASLVSRGDVSEDASGRIRVSAPGVRVVLEDEMTFAPGPYEIVAVAHETTTNIIASKRMDGEWPRLNEALVTISPVAVLQPADGIFLRGDETRTSGTLAFGETEPVRPDLPTALIALVCRARDLKGSVTIATRLAGENQAPFPTKDLDLGDDRCIQIRDVVPSGSLGDGEFQYEVVVSQRGQELARRERRFMALGEGASSATPASSMRPSTGS